MKKRWSHDPPGTQSKVESVPLRHEPGDRKIATDFECWLTAYRRKLEALSQQVTKAGPKQTGGGGEP